MTPQDRITIFMFDRDNPEIIPKVHDDKLGYKLCGNNVFSFAIPIPEHRQLSAGVCIELYYQDTDLLKFSSEGRQNLSLKRISCS